MNFLILGSGDKRVEDQLAYLTEGHAGYYNSRIGYNEKLSHQMYAGADFIKTSTGKISPAATMPVTLVMLEAIREFYYKTGIQIGMKPAGGISKSKLALHYLVMLNEVLGEEWMNNEWFRFGASSLANDILMQLMKQKTGVYQSADYFSID